MKAWFSSDTRVAALLTEAAKWIGTPFFRNSATPGRNGGVSCQMLANEIYRGVGFCSLDVPDADMSHAMYRSESLIIPYMEKRTDFAPLTLPTELMVGDLLGFKIKQAVHHLGILISPRDFVHVVMKHGCEYHSLFDPTYGAKLKAVWRPVE